MQSHWGPKDVLASNAFPASIVCRFTASSTKFGLLFPASTSEEISGCMGTVDAGFLRYRVSNLAYSIRLWHSTVQWEGCTSSVLDMLWCLVSWIVSDEYRAPWTVV